jgi:RNA polymerase sigma factor (sigma-70 family)
MRLRPGVRVLTAPDHQDTHADPMGVLVAQHDRFLAFIERRVGSREAAEEILQDAYARGLARQETLEDDTSVVAWFYRLLRNALVDHYRRRDAERRAMARAAEEARVAPPGATIDDELLQEVCTCATALVDTLKPEYAQALRVVDLADGDLDALATAAGIQKNNAAVRLHRARRALRTRLMDCCGRCFDAGCRDCGCEHDG